MLFIKEILILCLIYYWFIAICVAETVQVKVRPCKRGREVDAKSVIHEVKIGPCSTAGGTCELYKGHSATISVKFTPSEVPVNGSCKLKSRLVWLSKIEMDFGGISSNACDYMNCPLEANKEAVFNATFTVSKMWSTGSYPLKLRVHENAGNKRVLFCQLLKVQLTGQPAEIVAN